MDKQNRIGIPNNIRTVTNFNFQNEVRIYLVLESNDLILSNDKTLNLPCFGIVQFDNKYRFYLPKELRLYLGITSESQLLIYTRASNITIKKIG